MSRPAADPRLVAGLLRLYPAGWRERYAEEFAAVLVASMADGRRRWRVALDVVAGAADAHLHGDGGAQPDRIHNAAAVAFGAFAVFGCAGIAFQKMSEDRAFAVAGRAHATVAVAHQVVVFGAIAAMLAVLAGALPVGLAVVRQALGGRRDLRRLLLVPPLAAAAWVGLIFAVARLDHGPAHSPANIAAFVAVVVAGGVVIAASAAALVLAARRARLSAAVKRAQWLPMTGLSAAMVAVTVGVLVWGLRLHEQARALFDSDNGLLATPLAATWAGTLAAMAAATAVAVAATVRAVRLARLGSACTNPPG